MSGCIGDVDEGAGECEVEQHADGREEGDSSKAEDEG